MSQFELDLGYQYKSLKNRSRSLSAVEGQAKSRGASYSEFGADFFNALFQKSPHLRDDIDYNNKYNQVLRAFASSERFQSIRAQTKGNLNWSAIGASMLLDEISKTVSFEDEPEPEQNEQGDEQDKDEEDSEQGDDKSGDDNDKSEDSEDSGQDGESSESTNESGEPKPDDDSNGEPTDDNSESNDSGPNPAGDGDKSDGDLDKEEGEPSDDGEPNDEEGEGENQGEDNDEDSDDEDNEDGEGEGEDDDDLDEDGEPQGEGQGSDDLGDDFGEDTDDGMEQGPPKPLDEAIQDAINNAADKMDEMMKGIKAGHSSSIPGGDAKMVDDYTRLAQNKQLVQLLRMIGRLKLNNNFLAALSTANPEESMGVTIGNNIQRTLPRDLVKLAGDDDDFMIFMNKYNNKELLQRKYKSQSRPGKGPMIVCLDTSSSMSGGNMQWAQTIAAAMYMLAHKDNRLFAIVPFNDMARLQEPTNQLGRNVDVGMLSSILGMVARGGTNFDAAWQASIAFMRKHGGNWKNADIVFVTDGECGFDSEAWLKDKDKFNVRLFTFAIGMSQEDGKATWSEDYITRLARGNQHMVDSYRRYYSNLYGQPVHQTLLTLEEVSDAMVYVEKLDPDSEQQAFDLVKHAQQKKGKVVGAKR